MPLLSISMVDREGNTKAISVSIPTAATARVPAFLTTFQTFTNCKILGYGISESFVVVGGEFKVGDFDLVSEVANLRFKTVATNNPFQFKVPGAVDSAFDEEEEISASFAQLVKSALETLIGTADGLQYRGGTLIAKGVSRPVKIPDLEAA